MPLCMYVCLVTCLCMYGPSWVSVYLTHMIDTVVGGVGACNGCVSVMLRERLQLGSGL
jgi:hypothetical protein